MKTNGYPVDHPQYAITLSYEFLDDVSLEWAGFVTSEAAEHEETGLDAVMYKIKSALPENASKQVEIKSNHPLMLMVSEVYIYIYSCTDLNSCHFLSKKKHKIKFVHGIKVVVRAQLLPRFFNIIVSRMQTKQVTS